jgi:enhancing lycopene biosynthesis protein 2
LARQKPQQLCFAGSECEVDRDLKALALAMHQAGKPLGFICIAPALLPKILLSAA